MSSTDVWVKRPSANSIIPEKVFQCVGTEYFNPWLIIEGVKRGMYNVYARHGGGANIALPMEDLEFFFYLYFDNTGETIQQQVLKPFDKKTFDTLKANPR